MRLAKSLYATGCPTGGRTTVSICTRLQSYHSSSWRLKKPPKLLATDLLVGCLLSHSSSTGPRTWWIYCSDVRYNAGALVTAKVWKKAAGVGGLAFVSILISLDLPFIGSFYHSFQVPVKPHVVWNAILGASIHARINAIQIRLLSARKPQNPFLTLPTTVLDESYGSQVW